MTRSLSQQTLALGASRGLLQRKPPACAEVYRLSFGLTLFLLVASCANAQQSTGLRADLDRAAARYEPRDDSLLASDTEAIAIEAGTAYREGRLDDAVRGYDRAAGEAYRAGATGRAFEFALVTAEIEMRRGDPGRAAERFRRAALGNANHPQAASAHYGACIGAKRALDTSSPEAVLAYDQLLEEHQANWPHSKTSEEIRWQRVELLAMRGEWERLIARVRLVEPTDARYERAQKLLGLAHEKNLANNPETLQEATTDLQAILLGPSGRWPLLWSSLQRDCAIVLARGHLSRPDGGVDYSARLLKVALQGAPAPSPGWKRRAIPLLVVTHLLRKDQQAAAEQLGQEIASPEEQRRLIEGIVERLSRSTPLAEVDRLQATLNALRPLTGNAIATQSQGDLAHAQALASAGRREEAAAVFSQLVALRNNDRQTLTAFAQFLASSREEESLDRALNLWRRIEAQSERGTADWFTARLARLRLMATLGQREQAIKLLRLTRLMAPELGGTATRAEFNAIAESLR